MELRPIAFSLAILGILAPCPARGDDKPPTITIVFPQRAAFLSGPPQVVVQGIAEDAGTAVKRVEVNGQVASLFDGGHFSAPIPLEFGTNILTARATDVAGNQTSVSWSVLYAPSYRPVRAPVENGFAFRLGRDALISLENEIGLLSLNAIEVGKTTASIGLVTGGFEVTLDLKHVSSANPEFTSKSANVHAVVMVSVANGKFVTSMQGPPAVTLTKFRSAATLEKVAEGAVATGVQTELPPLLNATLGQFIQPRSFPDQGVVVQTSPRAISIDPRDVRVYVDGLVPPSLPPLPNDPPGSLSRNGATTAPPAFTTARDLSISVREDMVNRILQQAWASGKHLRISLDTSLLTPFFPALATMTGGQTVPVAIDFDLGLPPVVEVAGAPSLLTSSFGEVEVSIQVDLGSGFKEVLGLIVYLEPSALPRVVNNQLVITLDDPTRVVVSIDSNPLVLRQADIDQFVNVALPPLIVQLLQTFIPPIPLPSNLPKGFKPKNFSISVDGGGADFITIEGDV